MQGWGIHLGITTAICGRVSLVGLGQLSQALNFQLLLQFVSFFQLRYFISEMIAHIILGRGPVMGSFESATVTSKRQDFIHVTAADHLDTLPVHFTHVRV